MLKLKIIIKYYPNVYTNIELLLSTFVVTELVF